ncbi:hypothetical protein AGDE_08882 [Angomonas deanei]|nr:hypothetical protein AGDE_08882 [Angomonas deanei]|eukprot:EPY32067.1 hypothetical protein AGDE_08882 [Angomonas deanei]
MRRTLLNAGFLQGLKFGENANVFTSLWNKPETSDSRVKEYVPEVLEESLAEQRAVLEESTSRDVIVELGHKILLGIENKTPTPNIAPHLNKILAEFGSKDIISQRPLSYLLYPNSNATSAGEQAHELISNFQENFKTFVESVEESGCSIRGKEGKEGDQKKVEKKEEESEPAEGEEASGDKVIMTPKSEHEPMDITMFVKLVSGMALANMRCGDLRNAVRCVDAGIAHVVDQQRLGGLLGLKAGFLVHQKKYEEAVECANLAIGASENVQGFLQGSYALRKLGKEEEAVALLERGIGATPHEPVHPAPAGGSH